MKTKVCKVTPLKLFTVLFALFAAAGVTAFGQEGGADTLQGTWFEGDLFFWITFDNGSYETTDRGGEPNDKGEYIVSGNTITRTRTHTHSHSIGGGTRYGWFSREEAHAEFDGKFDSWFEPRTQTFSINSNVLTIVFPSGVEQQFTRVR